jgi:hypothetical protein
LNLTSAGLRHDTLLRRLLAISVPAEIEPLKRELLEHLAVTAASRHLERGDGLAARRVLQCGYYPASSRRAAYFTQLACALLPSSLGGRLYRSILQVKRATRPSPGTDADV